MAAHPLALAQLPNGPGLYRIRRAGDDSLIWLARTDGDVRAVGERLSRQVHLPNEPYDEPGGPAAMLRQLRRAGIACEISAVPILDDSERAARERSLRAAAGLGESSTSIER